METEIITPQLIWIKTDFLNGLAPIWYVYTPEFEKIEAICARVEYEYAAGRWVIDICNTIRMYQDGFVDDEQMIKKFAEEKLKEYLKSIHKLFRKRKSK